MSPETIHLSDTDLLLWIDREVSIEQALQIDQHLQHCLVCRARAAELEQALSGLVDLYRTELAQIPVANSFAEFQSRLAAHSPHPSHSLASLVTASVAAAAVILILAVAFTSGRSHNSVIAATPDSHLTPGDISPVTLHDVCSTNVSQNDPAVPDPLKREVLREYGLKDISNNSYEIDFLVTPQLGGAASIRNLWPQPAVKSVWNAHAKDELEDRLHSLVCSGQLDLSTAQRELSNNWVAAYKKYFRTNEPRAVSLLNGVHLAGTRRIRSSVASSTALRENGIG